MRWAAADCATIRQVVEAVHRHAASHLPISVALGELADVRAETALPCCDGISFAKFGLAGCGRRDDWPQHWARTLQRLPSTVGRVAVIYADWKTAAAPRPDEILRIAGKLNCRAALVDTFDKCSGSLVDLWSFTQIDDFIRSARSLGLLAVVGGGLKRENISSVVALAPDFVAVRGAVCRGQRRGAISWERIEQLVKLVRPPGPQRKGADRNGAGMQNVGEGAAPSPPPKQ